MMRKNFFHAGLLIGLSGLLFLGGGMHSASAFTDEQKLGAEAWRIVDRVYLDETFNHQNWWFIRQRTLKQPLQSQESAHETIHQMVASLGDPYTRFLSPDQYHNLQANTSGELTGLGLQISQDGEKGFLLVIAPIEGSPAERAGIKPGDRILAIDGIPTNELTLDEAADRMRGLSGTQVGLILDQDGQELMDITLTRDRITLNPVYAEIRPQSGGQTIGYIRLNQFNANASTEVALALRRLQKEGANAYIFDLRNNPGGLLQAGIEIARLWLGDNETIVYTVNRQGIQDSFEAGYEAITDAPLVVLVNQGTASASEILAGALQDNGRAQLVGETTFGKGLIQSLFDLSDGSGLAVTIAKYETPNHHDINRLGIIPDQVVPLNLLNRKEVGTLADPQYQAAVKLLTQPRILAGVS